MHFLFSIVHTSQALFETRSYISLMCRVGNNRKNECKTQWFDPSDKVIDTLGEKTDLVIRNATFDDNMGLYTCQICCSDQCQKLTSFVYPVRIYRNVFSLINQSFCFRPEKISKYMKETYLLKRLHPM
jgi:hypothetical protein